jgi:hypothetical protein
MIDLRPIDRRFFSIADWVRLTADHLVADFFCSNLGGTFDRGLIDRRFFLIADWVRLTADHLVADFFFKSGGYV